MNVQRAKYEIVYNGKDITKDILRYVKNFTYKDKSQGEADELELTMEDAEKLWSSVWYPQKGDTVSVAITTVEGVLKCGTFTVDEIAGESGEDGDIFTIKALAAGVNKKVRTAASYAHENKTLREIVNTIAAKHGFQVVGSIKDVRIGRVNQYNETDLKFLKRLSFEYGYTFSIRENVLLFTNIFDLENKASAFTIHRSEISRWSITDKTANTFSAAKVSYHDPKKKQLITHEQPENTEAFKATKADVLELKLKAENQQQAELKSRVALYRANSLQQEGEIELPGNIYAVAGNNCTLEGLGMFSGVYYIETSTHTVDPEGGYTTALSIKRVGLVNKTQQRKEKKTQTDKTPWLE